MYLSVEEKWKFIYMKQNFGLIVQKTATHNFKITIPAHSQKRDSIKHLIVDLWLGPKHDPDSESIVWRYSVKKLLKFLKFHREVLTIDFFHQ